MTSYTLFSQQATGSSLTTDAQAYTMGVQFSVSQTGTTLAAIWFFSATGASVLPQTIALFQVAGTSLVTSQAASWSGLAGSGWVRAVFSSPPALTISTAYKACVLQTTAVNWYSSTAGYWQAGAGSGGITNGPLSAPNNAGASPGQDSFNASATLTYPASTFNSTNYWVDPEVSAGASHNATASLTVTPAFSALRARGHSRTLSLAVTPSLHVTSRVQIPNGPVFSFGGISTRWMTSKACLRSLPPA